MNKLPVGQTIRYAYAFTFGEIGTTVIRRYESALRKGGYVFVVPAQSDNEKETIRKSLGSVKAREINAFSSWYTGQM